MLIFLLSGCGESDLLIKVPNFVNSRYQIAEKLAKERGLRIKTADKPEFSEFVPKDSIISQDPLAGSYIKTTREVYIIVSAGKEDVEVPDIVGKKFFEAQKLILKYGLAMGDIIDEPSNANDVGIVTTQKPPPGDRVQRYTPIQVTVSIGALLTVPNVVGLPSDQAVETFVQAGFKNVRIRPDKVQYAEPNTIVRQDPEAGLSSDSENYIDLYFNQP